MNTQEVANIVAIVLPGLFPKHGLTDDELDLFASRIRHLPFEAVKSAIRDHRAGSAYNKPHFAKIIEIAKSEAQWEERQAPREEVPHGVYVARRVKFNLGESAKDMTEADALMTRAKGMIDRAKEKMLPVGQYLAAEIINLRQWLPAVGCTPDQTEYLIDTLREYAGFADRRLEAV